MVSSFEGNEDARFQQEVEQVKQWWQVRRLFSPLRSGHAVIRPLALPRRDDRTDAVRMNSHRASRGSSARTPPSRSSRSEARSRSTTRRTPRARSCTPSSRKSSATASPATPMEREYKALVCAVVREVAEDAIRYPDRVTRSTRGQCTGTQRRGGRLTGIIA